MGDLKGSAICGCMLEALWRRTSGEAFTDLFAGLPDLGLRTAISRHADSSFFQELCGVPTINHQEWPTLRYAKGPHNTLCMFDTTTNTRLSNWPCVPRPAC